MANEKRLIYLEDAKEALTGWDTDPTDEEIEYTLDNLLTVDAVEVVRCKDCKRFCKYEQSSRNHCALSGRFVGEDDFCSFGEEGQPKQWERESDHEKL